MHTTQPMSRSSEAISARQKPPTKTSEPSVVSSKEKYPGICKICQSAPGCIFREQSTGPILQCDEFRGYTVISEKSTVKTSLPAIEVVSAAKAAGTYLGLCSNCKVRENCIYPKPEGGVWHCEMYE